MDKHIVYELEKVKNHFQSMEDPEPTLGLKIFNWGTSLILGGLLLLSFYKELQRTPDLTPKQKSQYTFLVNQCQDYNLNLPEKFSKLEGIALYTPIQAEISINGKKETIQKGCYDFHSEDLGIVVGEHSMNIYSTNLGTGNIYTLGQTIIAKGANY